MCQQLGTRLAVVDSISQRDSIIDFAVVQDPNIPDIDRVSLNICNFRLRKLFDSSISQI